MTADALRRSSEARPGFRHEALLYRGPEGFLLATVPFIEAAVESAEPVLVVVDEWKIDLLRAELGPQASSVGFADMQEIGGNPARILPVWKAFVDDHAEGGRPMRGIGEPVWPERSTEELDECVRHEALLNIAFNGAPPWWLVCPYDTEALSPAVIEEARRTHPAYVHDGVRRRSTDYAGAVVMDSFGDPLPAPSAQPSELVFRSGPLGELRAFVSARADLSGLDDAQATRLVLAVNEVATNSLRHAGGEGLLRVWGDSRGLVCEISDRGHIDQPMVGREEPRPDADGGRGLWIANQLCDLLQVRSSPDGTVVRLRVDRGSAGQSRETGGPAEPALIRDGNRSNQSSTARS